MNLKHKRLRGKVHLIEIGSVVIWFDRSGIMFNHTDKNLTRHKMLFIGRDGVMYSVLKWSGKDEREITYSGSTSSYPSPRR